MFTQNLTEYITFDSIKGSSGKYAYWNNSKDKMHNF